MARTKPDKDPCVHEEERPRGHTQGFAAAAGTLTAPSHGECHLQTQRVDLKGEGEKETQREKEGQRRGEKRTDCTGSRA